MFGRLIDFQMIVIYIIEFLYKQLMDEIVFIFMMLTFHLKQNVKLEIIAALKRLNFFG